MLVKILGAIDVIIGAILIFNLIPNLPTQILFFIGILFLVKSSLGMLKNLASWIDFLIGILFIISIIITIPSWIMIILGILVIQKGIISFL